MFYNKVYSIAAGLICGLSFAPILFTPGIFMLSILCWQISVVKTWRQAFLCGYLFGIGFFLTTLYWICIGVSVYIDEFWWAIPFALFGLPLLMATFIGITALGSWFLKENKYYHFIFCVIWVLVEWLTCWVLTGLPWGLIGYAFAGSDILIQSASIYGVLGLSFLGVYIGSSLYSLIKRDYQNFRLHLITSAFLIILIILYGYLRLSNNLTELSSVKVRIVQPAIPQTNKWDEEVFWYNLNQHILLSIKSGDPDMIVWSEAALVIPYYHQPILDSLKSVFTKDKQALILGGINDNSDKKELYSSLLALGNNGELWFDYHKSHLVPFGEYIPFKKILSFKKITHGLEDYTPGIRKEAIFLEPFNLKIQPLICYEAIFPAEVRISNQDADLIINITNDTWYGNSSGPYQHFEISRMRAVENGLPMIRSGNNGISAIIDPLGRVLSKLNLNEISILDGFIPVKLASPTLFSQYEYVTLLILLLTVLIMKLLIKFVLNYLIKIGKVLAL